MAKKESMGAVHTAWNWKPDAKTEKAIQVGNRKIKAALDPKSIKPPQETPTMQTQTAKRTSVRKAPPKATAAKAEDPNLISLKKLCGTEIDPRTARRVLRKAKIAGHNASDRWTFKKDSASLTKAREVLKALKAN